MSDTAAVLAGIASATVSRPDQFGASIGGQQSLPWGYWRRNDGTIIIGQYSANEYMNNRRRGNVPLEHAPKFVLNDPKSPYREGDGYRLLLEAGLAGEFTIKQILENGWHRKPPVVDGKPVKFPQIRRDGEGRVLVPNAAGVDEPLEEATCPICMKVFLSVHDLQRHESVAHKDTSTQNQLARLMTQATTGQMAPTNEAMVEALKTLATAVQSISNQQADLQTRQERQEERFLAVLERMAPPEPERRGPGRPPYKNQ